MLYFLIIIGVTGVLLTLRVLIERALFLWRERRERELFEPHVLSEEETIIDSALKRLSYYRNLSQAGKDKFIARTKRVIRRVRFSTAGNINATDEKRILVIASIVQITFGLDDYDIDTIDHIKLFENNIYNPRTKVQYKGLTFTNGNLYLAWDHFMEGLSKEDDGINLGLHETAHGLYILMRASAFKDFDSVLDKWMEQAGPEIKKTEIDDAFFRMYAGTNREEFFSVCIENFFERPTPFKNRLPLIYKQLCTFLNQDPANKNDYVFIPEGTTTSSGEIQERLYLHKDKWDSSYTFFILFSYISLVFVFVFKNFILETYTTIILFSIPCMVISYYGFKNFYVNKKRMSKRKYLLFSITAINPVVLIALLGINLVVPLTSTRT